jgi:dTDP-4-amino-4,6-dideoxygalactose transaminase
MKKSMNLPSNVKHSSWTTRIFLSPPHMGKEERLFVQAAFESNYIAPLGPQVDAFEEEFSKYTGIKYCVALSSGTAAMHLALQELGVGPGDEVIGSSLTFIGSVSPVIFLGAGLVFVDCDRESWNMDTDLLAEALEAGERRGKLPKAVIPTDLYGQCADYDRIFDICDSYSVPVVVDAAEAMGAIYTGNGRSGPESKRVVHAGKGAKASVFSFNGNKIMTTSGGGMLASDDKELIDRARFLSQQARDPFSYYEHSEIGYNYRMSNVLAGIGRGQLKILEERVHRKREIFEYYQSALKYVPGIEFMPEASYGKCNRWLTVILINPEDFGVDCKLVQQSLENENIESRPVWKPMHLQPVFDCGNGGSITNSTYPMEKRYKARMIGGSVSEEFFAQGLCLPSGTAMTDYDMDRVIEIILKCRK